MLYYSSLGIFFADICMYRIYINIIFGQSLPFYRRPKRISTGEATIAAAAIGISTPMAVITPRG